LNNQQFLNAMLRYAKVQPRFAPEFSDPFVIELWYESLSGFGAEALGAAMRKLITRDRFPSIDAIKQACGGGDLNTDMIARDTADRIFAAICRFGSTANSRWEEIAEKIGEVGVLVVGGPSQWQMLCEEVTTKNSATYKAQWRELAKAKMEYHHKGIDGAAQLPAPPPRVSAQIEQASASVHQLAPSDVADSVAVLDQANDSLEATCANKPSA